MICCFYMICYFSLSSFPFQIFFIEVLLPFGKLSDSFPYPRTVKTFLYFPYFYFWEKWSSTKRNVSKKMFISFIRIIAFFKLPSLNFSKSLFKWFDGLFIAVTFVNILDLLALINRFVCSQSHRNRKMSITSVLKMAVLNWQVTMQFVMIWAIAVAEFFPSFVGLFIVGIMLYQYIKLKKLYTFFFTCNLKR